MSQEFPKTRASSKDRLQFRIDPTVGDALRITLWVRFRDDHGCTSGFSLGDWLTANSAREGHLSVRADALEGFVFAKWEDGHALTIARQGKLPFVLLRGLQDGERKELGLRLTHALETRGLLHLAAHLSDATPTLASNWQAVGVCPRRAPHLSLHPAHVQEPAELRPASPIVWATRPAKPAPKARPNRPRRIPNSRPGRLLDCNRTSQSGPFRGATRSTFEIALEEKPRLMVPGFLARIFSGERPFWRRTTRKVSFEADIVRSVIVDNFEGRQPTSEDNAPTRSQTFDLQRIVLEDVEQFWFSTDNVLWIRRAEDDVALIGGLSNDQRLTIQRDLERYLVAKGKIGLFDARTRAA